VANYVGTYWPVGDAAALTFARIFYQTLLAGESLHRALLQARNAVHAIPSVDWADYVLYGNPEFVLKRPTEEAGEGGRAVGPRRDLAPLTWVICSGPPGTPPGLLVDVDDGLQSLTTEVPGVLDIGTHEFVLRRNGKAFAARIYCKASSVASPLRIQIDREAT